MTLAEFRNSTQQEIPPAGISVYLKALWFDGRDDWEAAHTSIQDVSDSSAAWIHAYLHRKEGDLFNADYWYKRAGKKRPASSLEEEWEDITVSFLEGE